MNVKQLRELIADLPDDMEIICSADAEGNGYSDLSGAWQGYYKSEGYRDGYVIGTDEPFSDYEELMDPEEWEQLTSGPKSLIFTPG